MAFDLGDFFSRWGPFLFHSLRWISQGVIEGSKAAGVNHDTVALTIAKTVTHLVDGVQPQGTAQLPLAAARPPER